MTAPRRRKRATYARAENKIDDAYLRVVRALRGLHSLEQRKVLGLVHKRLYHALRDFADSRACLKEHTQ